MTKDGDKHAIRVLRIDDNSWDLLAIAQSEMPPGSARVG